ncbi:hypothetical protein N7456_002128 [Penicillium angulare]|uniref:Aminoglycoside phosphotransferase domain-containing protein n=1 Tax=Penicillium angulare TaxID=116970 RepID=A0A9W9KNR0_9EURO|nr:hypothetical protein N7456_002128 [Penicillium angulare]
MNTAPSLIEPFELLYPRIHKLWQQRLEDAKLTVFELESGPCHRILQVRVTQGQGPGYKDYILRIPWPWFNDIPFMIHYEVAPLELLKFNSIIPVPKVVAHDCTWDNPIRQPYVILECMAWRPLREVYCDLSPDEKRQIATQVAEMILNIQKVRDVHPGRPIWSHKTKGVLINPIDGGIPKSPTEARSSEEPSTQNYFQSFILQKVACAEGNDKIEASYLRRLHKIFLEMVPFEIWDDTDYVLSHGDLHMGNILVDGLKISGIIDWNLAQFAPRWYGCVPPVWLWDRRRTSARDEMFSAPRPINEEQRKVKQIFDDAVSPVFTRLAYQTQYRLARQLVNLIYVDPPVKSKFEALAQLESQWRCWRMVNGKSWRKADSKEEHSKKSKMGNPKSQRRIGRIGGR